MTEPGEPTGVDEHRLEILGLLDDRHRLREDPNRRGELDAARNRVRETLGRLREYGTLTDDH
jgi:hypothetical protein